MCHFCHKKGQSQAPPQRVHAVTAAEKDSSPEEDECHLFHIEHKQSKTKPLLCTLTIEDKPVEMEIDTGADVSIMAERTYQQLFSHKPLQPSTVRLTTYVYTSQGTAGAGLQWPADISFDTYSCCRKWPKSALKELAP